MTTVSKVLKRQDSGLKLGPGPSGETSINLRQDFLPLLADDLKKGSQQDITFKIYRQDFIDSVEQIKSHLPLYKTTSQSSEQLGTDSAIALEQSLRKEIDDFFDGAEEKDYSCSILYRTDSRVYLNNLKSKGFSIRDFLVENHSEIVFEKVADQVHLHVKFNEENNNTTMDIKYTEKLIVSHAQLRTFALKCITHLSSQPDWDKIENYIANVDAIAEPNPIKVSKPGLFSLVGMFRCCSIDGIVKYNTPRKRWYTEPFTISGKTVFLSTEWYPGKKDDGTPYDLMIPDLVTFIRDCYGEDYIYKLNNGIHELWERVPVEESEVVEFDVARIIETIKSSGLVYSEDLVSRYVISLMTKPFTILSGLAGSGKTQLAIAFAKAICEDVQKQVRIVPVGADWTNREPLLGYPNALESGKYVRPESGVLQLIQDAIEDETHPYFLILDEMNLSYVERYFADFLSSIESHSPILLWDKNADGVPMSISLPRNLFIVGTINVDETTYMFSPKVLDRANVIEFKINESEMRGVLEAAPIVDLGIIEGAIADIAPEFVNVAKSPVETEFEGTSALLLGFFKALKSVNAEFGYRSASEIGRFITLAHDKGNLPIEKAVDAAIVQKLLPKLHGSRKKLVPVLTTLWDMCDAGIGIELADEVPEQTRYPLTADKLLRMYRGAIDNGFTSFAEA